MNTLPLVVVDAANTVGSVPDGWWRDRRAAALRLRDALAPLAEGGLPDRGDVPAWARTGPLEVVLVTEGAGRGVPSAGAVRVDEAPGSGDDRVVELIAGARRAGPDRPVLLVTADRELRARAAAHGAVCAGPGAVTSAYRRTR